MNTKQPNPGPKALVTVFEDPQAAKEVVEALHANGFSLENIELVTHDVHSEAPEVTTPKVHETTATSLVESAAKWGGVGAGIGALAAVVTGFPGIGLGMIIMGGAVGAFTGGIAGIEHACDDDSVDLPTLDEYEQMVRNGHALVVVLGTHDEAMRAENVIGELPHIHQNIHPSHGHEFHEHPAQ
jgi:hypothetical protein